jgi:hypothetical protein
MARFNLSCALAKAGELSQARDELRRLLHQDLPRFRQRVLTDPDLQSLRQSEHWTDLQRNIGELEAQWRQVARLGLPVVALPTLRSVAPDPLQATRSLPEARAGVYLSQVNRFVPLAAPMDGALGLTVADDRSKVLSVRGVGALDAQGSLSSLRVESIDSFGEAGPGYAAPLVYTPTTDALWTALDFPLDAGKPTFHDSKSLLGRPVQTALRVQAHYTAFVNDQSDARARKALLRLPEQTRLLYAPIRKAPLGSDEPDRINFAGGSTFLPHGVLLYAVFERCALDGINQVLSHAMHYVSNEGLVLALADGAAGGVAVRLVGDVLMLQSGEETLLLDANNPRLSESHKLPRQLYLSPPFAASSCTLGT